MLKDLIPPGECDLVMKGGITSGIVYPSTLLELQKHYKFRSIGGTSAGAIAAVAAAAAEYNRDGIGFNKLEWVQKWLSTNGNLRNLFQAPAETKPLFDVLSAVLEAQEPTNKMTTAEPAGQTTGPTVLQGNEPQSKHLFLRVLSMFFKGLVPSLSLPPKVFPIVDDLIDRWTLAKDPYLPYKRGGNVGMGFGILGGIMLVLVLLGVALVVLGIVSLFGQTIEARMLLILLIAGVLLSGLFGLIFGWIGTWLGRVVGVALDLRDVLVKKVPENFYGVCTGHTMEDAPANDTNALPYGTNLTDWLSDLLDTTAGFKSNSSPLTFGQLQEKQINLKMVTSNLSHGQPYVLPEGLENFMFNATEMRKLFPKYIVDHMIKNPPCPLANLASVVIPPEKLPPDYYLLPDKDHLPVVVGARLSLSFPLLLSAVPFYTLSAAAFNARNSIGVFDPQKHFQRNWFSDGGICNNFPIEFFDAWLPTRPTFGINLTSMPTDETTSVIVAPQAGQQSVNTTDDVYLPRAEDRLDPQWNDIDGKDGASSSSVSKLVKFLTQIFGTAQNYRDNLQSNLPSYRERIVQIRLDEQEGGLKFTMPTDIINSMVNKGQKAGTILCPTDAERAEPEKLQTKFNFDHHWWVRFLVVMAQLEQNVENLQAVFDDPVFQNLLDKQFGSKATPPLYPYWRDENWCKEAKNRITELRTLIDCWNTAPQPGGSSEFFRTNAPLPDPVLRVTLEV